MRELEAERIREAVARLCIEACQKLPPDAERALRDAEKREPWPPARAVLGDICQNMDIAAAQGLPLCQDTGVVSVFAELGQDVHVSGDFNAAVQAGVAAGYQKGYLRKSMVGDPLTRENTGDNTPASIYIDLVPGEALRLTVAPKGGGSENMCRLKMLKPAEGEAGVRDFVLSSVREAGGNPCPPVVVGVGVGGDFASVAQNAKKALLRPLDTPNPHPFWDNMEKELLAAINETGVGPAGLGGKTTALAVLINPAPTHIAMLPVAVCLSCHVCRHATEVL